MHPARNPLAVALAAAFTLPAVAAAESPAAGLEAPTVEVIGTTPVPGIGTPVEQIPANVQAATAKELERQQSTDLSEFLDNNLGSVNSNATLGNPFVNDVNFRGFAASPLLGTPQGMSVFMDGVRINEPFGDVVNWDLIPSNAISSINLIPGSNPVFGLNTLGGALAVHTKTGFQYPGFRAKLSGGSWERHDFEVEHGGHGEQADWFVAGRHFEEDGWRDFSPSRVRQLFAKVGYEAGDTDFDFSFSGADNRLQGTQALPLSMLNNTEQAYTWPDQTENKLAFFNASGNHFFSDTLLLAGNAYYRNQKQDAFNSNVNDDFNPLVAIGPGNTTAVNDSSTIDQDGWGGSVQITSLADLAGYANTFTVGVSADLGKADFAQYAQEAVFGNDRGTFATDAFQLETLVKTENHYYGVYFTDTFSFTERWHLTLSGRYNKAKVQIRDRSGNDPLLNGSHEFSRFNPAVGLTFNPLPRTTTYLTYNEGMRAPSPVELTCADPSAPCKLPNNFLADPPLEPVVSHTWEAGARGPLGDILQWNAAVYRTRLDNDIAFVSSGGAALNAGFFQNVGRTRRQGIELGLTAKLDELTLTANYGFVDATFESPLTINSPANSSADANGDIHVRKGNRIPGIPRHNFKLRAEYALAERFTVGANLVAATDQYARGDENNQDSHGTVPGYTVVHLDASYRVAKSWEIFARVNNLFDEEYESFGVLGENFFTGPGNTFDPVNATNEQFRTPGSPRAAWVGLRFELDGK